MSDFTALTPYQTVFGLAEADGATFFYPTHTSLIGGPEDAAAVIQIATWCDGQTPIATIYHQAQAIGLAPDLVKTILETLLVEDIIQSALPAGATSQADVTVIQQANWIVKHYVGPNKLLPGVHLYKYHGYHEDVDESFPYFSAEADFENYKGQPSGGSYGSAANPALAVIKAVAEGVERYYMGASWRVDRFATASALDKPYHLDQALYHYQAPYLQDMGFQPFDIAHKHPWVVGHNVNNGQAVYVLADLIFFPLSETELGRPRVSPRFVSGGGTYFNREAAIQHGLFEVIERDAIAVTWYGQRAVTAIPPAYTPPDVQARLNYWASQGRQMKLLNLTLDSIPIVMVLSVGDRYPFIVAGAAAAETYPAAIRKALAENEMIIMTWSAFEREAAPITVTMTPDDHGSLYASPGQQDHIAWLLAAPEVEPEAKAIDLAQVYHQFEPVVVDLHAPTTPQDWWVVKVLSNKLLPLIFGHQGEPHGHPRLQELGLKWRNYPAHPHFFA